MPSRKEVTNPTGISINGERSRFNQRATSFINLFKEFKLNTRETPNYPVNSFPPRLAQVIWEQFYNNEGPLSMIASSVLAVLSVVCSQLVNVARFPGIATPTSLYLLSVAGSGYRKTFIDNMIMKVLDNFQTEAVGLMKKDVARHTAERMNWKADRIGIEKRLRGELGEHERQDLVDKLEELLLNEPMPLYAPRIKYRDVTQEALARGLHRTPSLLVHSNDAGRILNSRLMSNHSFFNDSWGGDDIIVDRVSTESFVVKDPRLTLSLMVQEKTFRNYLRGKGHLAEDSGFLYRFLICQPDSLEGMRFSQNYTGSWMNLQIFHARIREILLTWLPVNGVYPERKLLELSTGARLQLNWFANEVEADLGPGGLLSDVKGSGSKAAEQAARLAALFHNFEGDDGPISEEMMSRATYIIAWYLKEFKRLFGTLVQTPTPWVDAQTLETEIHRLLNKRPDATCVPRHYLLTNGPKPRMNKTRLDPALEVLMTQNKIEPHLYKGKLVYALNPMFFPIYPRLQPPPQPPFLNI